MGSLEEERLFQMVHEFMESDQPLAPISKTSPCNYPETISMHQTTCQILESILGSCTDAEIEIYQRALKHVKEIGEERKSSSLKRRLMMSLRKDGYDASLCRSSWVATMEYPGGDYEYIDILVAGEDGVTNRLIVDIDFRSQFELARPTSSYTQISNALPAVFVGPQDKIKKVVSLLCRAAEKSLKESGLHIPPWRRSSYMQSKWLPCCGPRTYTKPPLPSVTVPKGGMAHKGKSGSHERADGPRRSGLSRQFSGLGINCC